MTATCRKNQEGGGGTIATCRWNHWGRGGGWGGGEMTATCGQNHCGKAVWSNGKATLETTFIRSNQQG